LSSGQQHIQYDGCRVDERVLPGRLLLAVIDPVFLLAAMLGLLMTGLGLIGNLAHLEGRVFSIELDALALMIFYFGGLWLLFTRGITQ
jgi:hypothetical protein